MEEDGGSPTPPRTAGPPSLPPLPPMTDAGGRRHRRNKGLSSAPPGRQGGGPPPPLPPPSAREEKLAISLTCWRYCNIYIILVSCCSISIISDSEELKWPVHRKNPVQTALLPAFEFSTGPIPRTKSQKSPMKVFQLFMILSLLGIIVTQMNLYVQEKGVTFKCFCTRTPSIILHYCKKGEEGYDPLFKVRPMIDHLLTVFPIITNLNATYQ